MNNKYIFLMIIFISLFTCISCDKENKKIKFEGLLNLDYKNYDTLSIVKKLGYKRVVSDIETFIKEDKDTIKAVTFESETNTIRNIDWFIKIDSIDTETVKKFMKKEKLRLISPFQFYSETNKSDGFSLVTVRNYDNNIFFIRCSKDRVNENETENFLSIGYFKPLTDLELEESITKRKKWEETR